MRVTIQAAGIAGLVRGQPSRRACAVRSGGCVLGAARPQRCVLAAADGGYAPSGNTGNTPPRRTSRTSRSQQGSSVRPTTTAPVPAAGSSISSTTAQKEEAPAAAAPAAPAKTPAPTISAVAAKVVAAVPAQAQPLVKDVSVPGESPAGVKAAPVSSSPRAEVAAPPKKQRASPPPGGEEEFDGLVWQSNRLPSTTSQRVSCRRASISLDELHPAT